MKTCRNYTRRNALKMGAIAGFGSLSLPALLELEASTKKSNLKSNKSVIIIWMQGGPSHHETFDPKPYAVEAYRGHFDAIPTNVDGIQISDHLNKSAKIMDKWNIVRGLHHNNNSHASAYNIMYTGYKAATPGQTRNSYPSIGSVVSEHAKRENPQVPPYVTIPTHNPGTRPVYLGQDNDPYQTRSRPSSSTAYKDTNFTLTDSLTINRLDNRNSLLDGFDRMNASLDKSGTMNAIDEFTGRAYDMLSAGKAAKAFDIESEPDHIKQLYGFDGNFKFGRDALLARRLVESGVRLVSITTPFGWDTHSNSGKSMSERNLPELDLAWSSLITDLDQRGMLKDTMVIAWGEFGRTPKVNGNSGRDHWANCMTCAIAGGDTKGGCFVGESDKTGSYPIKGYTPADVLQTAYSHLGINSEYSYVDHSGRPIPILNQGKVIEDLL